jgi:hypothetical protein
VLIHKGLRLSAEITRPPELGNLKINTEAEITHLDPSEGLSIEFGIHFLLSEERIQQLQKALHDIAKHKLNGGDLSLAKKAITEIYQNTDVQSASREICDILIGNNSLNPEQAQAAKFEATATNTSVTRMLMKHRSATPVKICHALSEQSGLPITNLESCDISRTLWNEFSYLTMQRYEFVPMTETKEQVFIAAAHPLPLQVLNELERTTRRPIFVFLAPLDQIQRLQFQRRPGGALHERRNSRTRIHVHAVYQFCNEQGINTDNQQKEGIVSNMSDGGFLLVGPAEAVCTPSEFVKKNMCVRIEFNYGDLQIHAFCKLRHIETIQPPTEDQPTWAMGMQILQIDPAEAQKLRDACTRAAIDQMKKRNKKFIPNEQ